MQPSLWQKYNYKFRKNRDMEFILRKNNSNEIEKLRKEIADLQHVLSDKNDIILRQGNEITRLSHEAPLLQEVEKLLNISKAELNSAIGKIELSTNNAISGFSNITGIFGNTIKSTSELVSSIKEKLNIVASKGGVASTYNDIEVTDSSAIHDKYEAIINHIIDEMTSIVKRKEEDLSLLDEVNSKVIAIKSFTNEISKIASFSHILSINARIEAAQAGEKGKGFTVVAAEISRMALETKNYSEKIDLDLTTAKTFIENSTQTLKKAIDIESLFINSTIFLMKDVFMSVINGLISLINVIEKTIGESSDINNSIQDVVVNLQFEDITKQIGTHVIQQMSLVIESIQSLNLIDQETGGKSINANVNNLTKHIHTMFTMESERKIASNVLVNSEHEIQNDCSTNAIKEEPEEEGNDVTFF